MVPDTWFLTWEEGYRLCSLILCVCPVYVPHWWLHRLASQFDVSNHHPEFQQVNSQEVSPFEEGGIKRIIDYGPFKIWVSWRYRVSFSFWCCTSYCKKLWVHSSSSCITGSMCGNHSQVAVSYGLKLLVIFLLWSLIYHCSCGWAIRGKHKIGFQHLKKSTPLPSSILELGEAQHHT